MKSRSYEWKANVIPPLVLIFVSLGCLIFLLLIFKSGCVMEMADPLEIATKTDAIGSINCNIYAGPIGSEVVIAVCGLPDEVPISGGCFCSVGYPYYFETVLDPEPGFGCICEPAGDDQATVLCISTETVEGILRVDPEKQSARAISFHNLFLEKTQNTK